MKVGIFSFNTEYTIRADELAVEAENRGFDSVWFPEHTHIPSGRKTPYPAGGALPKEYIHMSDPFISCMAAAQATQTIKVGTGVSLLPQHEPLAMAKTVATLDRLTNGRFLYGIGSGWNADEMENHGAPYEKRWKVLEEHLLAMKELWTKEEASFHGEFVNFDKVWSYPNALTLPHPPIILGTFGSKWGRQRVADLADGWVPIGLFSENMHADIEDLNSRLIKNGREANSVEVSIFSISAPLTPVEELEEYANSDLVTRVVARCPTESRDSVLKWMDGYADFVERVS